MGGETHLKQDLFFLNDEQQVLVQDFCLKNKNKKIFMDFISLSKNLEEKKIIKNQIEILSQNTKRMAK